ncbi:hypothetical protein JCM8547_008824 [Rhodosporidiobolus lusitaniae]
MILQGQKEVKFVLDFEEEEKPKNDLFLHLPALAAQLAASSQTPFGFDVLLDFPLCKRRIWSSEAILSKSPYLEGVLSSDFLEGSTTTTSKTFSSESSGHLPCDDSDEEKDEALVASSQAGLPLEAPAHKTITITETAYSTYLATICWMQTGHIAFSSRSSASVAPKQDSLSASTADSFSPLMAVSPKSVYRLSHLLDLPDLSSLALANSSAQLNTRNAAVELFSETSALYDEVGVAVLDFAVEHLEAIQQSDGMKEAEKRADLGEANEWELRVWAKLARRVMDGKGK